MNIKEKILAVLAGIGAFFSAVFFVLLKQSKIDNKDLQEEKLELKEEVEKIESVVNTKEKMINEKQKINEKKERTVTSCIDGSISNADILSNLAAKSQNRVR